MPIPRLLLILLWSLAVAQLLVRPVHADEPFEVEIIHLDGERGITTAFVSVLGEDGRAIEDLDERDFTVSVNGRELPKLELTNYVDDSLGVAVVLAIDVSGSMEPYLGDARDGASALVSLLKPADEAALVSFSDAVTVEQQITGSRLDIESALAGLETGGNTSLHEVVLASLDLAADAELERRAVVLLSDGQDTLAAAASRAAAIERARADQIPIYAIGYGPDPDRQFLTELARASGGRELFAPGPSDLRIAFEELGDLLRRQYVVRFAPGVAPATRTLELTLEVATDTGSGIATMQFENPIAARPVAPAATAAPPVPTAQPATVPPPAAVEEPAEAPSSSNNALLLVPLALVVLGGAVLLLRRRRRRPEALASYALRQLDPAAAPAAERPSVGRADAVLSVVEGPHLGDRVPVTDEVVTIGRGPTCTLRLPGSYEEVATEQARVWWRDGRLMLHGLDRSWSTRVNGVQVEWATLEPGDRFEIGPYTLELERGADASPAPLAEMAAGGD
jgi:VWFA-related protein